jgi:CO/xanthine dehydrogenase Mo-binding subunit
VTVIDAGRILNPLAGRNQIEGAVVMGIGMALFEHTSYDPQSGAPITAAVHHATGVRVRELPVKIENLLA